MLICFWFWSWNLTCATRMCILKAPFILKCFEHRWHWNFFISSSWFDCALSLSQSLLAVKLWTKLKCKFSKCSSTKTNPQISQRNFSSVGFTGDGDIFTNFIRVCFAFGSFFDFEVGGCSIAFSSDGSEWPKRWIVNLSKPRRTSLHNGHLIGLLFTLIRFSLNVSMSGNFERQHSGHDNSEHIFSIFSRLLINNTSILMKFISFGTFARRKLWKTVLLLQFVCILRDSLKIELKKIIEWTENDHFHPREMWSENWENNVWQRAKKKRNLNNPNDFD